MPADAARLSLNQITTEHWSLRETAEGCARHGIGWIGVWRHKLQGLDAREAGRMIRENGLEVSSLCRGGMFPAATGEERVRRIDDNLRAIDDAAVLGAHTLVLVNGPAPNRDIDGARRMVADGIAAILPHAAERDIRLGIEPLHPMFAGDRSVIVTLGEANTLVEELGSRCAGVVIDAYHVWWDPHLYREIARARGRIFGFHVSDWIAPVSDASMCRGMMGDGVIELRRIRQAVDAAGYAGPIEVEIFNREIWNEPGDEALERVREAYLAHV